MSVPKVNLAEAFTRVSEAWSPRVVGDVNDMQVKIAKFRGAFDWHHHAEEDELFLVVDGVLRMNLRDGPVDVSAGEFIVVPHGVEHRPEALTPECHVVMIEPRSTLNTGNLENERTLHVVPRLDD